MRFPGVQPLVVFALATDRTRTQTRCYKYCAPRKSLLTDRAMSLPSSAPKCEPCSGLDDSAKLSIDEANAALAALGQPSSTWTIKESVDGLLSLSRRFTAKNFQAALDAINDIGAVAESENHHPDLHLTNYRDVEIEIYTHKVKGLTRNDFILAELIDSKVSIEYSPKWLRENPDAAKTSKTRQKNK